MNAVDGVVSLVEVISNGFVSPAFNFRKVFFEAGVKDASSFTEVELSASGAMNDVCIVVRQAAELLRDVHLGLRASNVGVGADERTHSTCCLIAWSGPWSSCGWVTHLRWHQHVTDVGVGFDCDQWCHTFFSLFCCCCCCFVLFLTFYVFPS